jgi:hypothetical protein
MPNRTTLTIANGESTPVDVPFVPKSGANNVSTFVATDGVPVGDRILTVSSTHGNREKASIRFKLPVTVTETVNGVSNSVVARTAYVRMDFDFAGNSTLEEREDAVAFAANILDPSQTAIMSILKDLHDFY